MSKNLKIALKAGQCLCINGAVIRADRKVRIELVNEAAFLLEQHIMAADEATSPLRQLYFAVQCVLMGEREAVDAPWPVQLAELRCAAAAGSDLAAALDEIAALLASGSHFPALRIVRRLLAREAEFVTPSPPAPP